MKITELYKILYKKNAFHLFQDYIISVGWKISGFDFDKIINFAEIMNGQWIRVILSLKDVKELKLDKDIKNNNIIKKIFGM